MSDIENQLINFIEQCPAEQKECLNPWRAEILVVLTKDKLAVTPHNVLHVWRNLYRIRSGKEKAFCDLADDEVFCKFQDIEAKLSSLEATIKQQTALIQQLVSEKQGKAPEVVLPKALAGGVKPVEQKAEPKPQKEPQSVQTTAPQPVPKPSKRTEFNDEYCVMKGCKDKSDENYVCCKSEDKCHYAKDGWFHFSCLGFNQIEAEKGNDLFRKGCDFVCPGCHVEHGGDFESWGKSIKVSDVRLKEIKKTLAEKWKKAYQMNLEK